MPSLFPASTAMPAPPPAETLAALLHRVFGHRDFRPHQQQVCEAAAAGRDVLLVMPTGAGKSLCYQLPALARRGGAASGESSGTALVISPLIALMDDQAQKLTALGLRVARIHSGLDREQSRQACRDYLSGELDFLFIAPERMRVPGFPEMLAKRKPSLIAIDEAHCISQWGHDFRPDYRTLGQYLPALRPSPIIALTATATPTVQRDIVAQLALAEPAVFITGFRRHNLAVEVVELSKPQRAEYARKVLSDDSARPAILYAGSRKQAEELAAALHKHFPTAAYHAGLDPNTRDRVQRAFSTGKLDVVVATVAFGMGVDKADVRTVIHVTLPGSVEAYYQEIGRAGRDGKPSRTILLHNFSDRRLQEFFLEKNYPPTSDLERVAAALPMDFAPVNDIHNALVSKKVAIDRETLDRTLEKLLIAGLAEMDIAGDVRVAPQQASGAKWQTAYEQQVAARRAQIDHMVAFAESTTCRMAALVRHFGDTTDRAATCGLCDVCNPAGAGSSNAAHQPTAHERTQLRTILKALEGRSTSTGKLFTDLALVKDRKDFDALLDGLARAGLIALTNDTFRTPEGVDRTYRKASITPEGREPDDRALDTVWLRTNLSTPAAKRSRSKSGDTVATRAAGGRAATEVLTPDAEALFERLRAWRTEVARPTKTPAFMILSDAVLRGIAQRAPSTLADLHATSGMGQTKIDRYGADLLAVCRGESPKASVPAQAVANRSIGRERPADAVASRSTVGGYPVAIPPRAVAAPVQRAAPRAQVIAIPASPAAMAREERLKAWRADEARRAGLPSFFILSDTALHEIALAAPANQEALRGVRGVGPEKVTKYGDVIVAMCG